MLYPSLGSSERGWVNIYPIPFNLDASVCKWMGSAMLRCDKLTASLIDLFISDHSLSRSGDHMKGVFELVSFLIPFAFKLSSGIQEDNWLIIHTNTCAPLWSRGGSMLMSASILLDEGSMFILGAPVFGTTLDS